MLYYAIVFLAIALGAASLGLGGTAAGAAPIAHVLFTAFLVATAIALVMGRSRGSI